jgi:hypothetical protein
MTRLRTTCCNWTRSAAIVGRSGRSSCLDGNAVLLQLLTGEGKHFGDGLVYIYWAAFRRGVLQHGADAAQHVARAIAVTHDSVESVFDLINIRRRDGEEAPASVAVHDDRPERLIDLVRD